MWLSPMQQVTYLKVLPFMRMHYTLHFISKWKWHLFSQGASRFKALLKIVEAFKGNAAKVRCYTIKKIEKQSLKTLFFTWEGYFNDWLFRTLPVFPLCLLFILNFSILPRGHGEEPKICKNGQTLFFLGGFSCRKRQICCFKFLYLETDYWSLPLIHPWGVTYFLQSHNEA